LETVPPPPARTPSRIPSQKAELLSVRFARRTAEMAVSPPESTTGLAQLARRHMRLLFWTQALSVATFQLMPALGGVMLLHLTGKVAATGLALSLSGLGQILTAYPAGRWMDRVGRGPVFATSGFLSALAAALVGWTFQEHHLWGFAGAVLLFGALSAPLRQLSVAAADLHPPEERGKAVGYLLMGSVVGALISPLLSSSIVWIWRNEVSAIAWTWFGAAALQLGILPLMRLLRPDPKEVARRYLERTDPEETAASAGVPATAWGLAAAITAYAASWGIMTLSMAIAPVAMRAHGHGVSEIVWAITLHSIGMFAFGRPLGAIADRLGRLPLMAGSLAVIALSTFGSVATGEYWTATFFLFLVGVGWSGGVVASTALLSDLSTAEDRGRRFGVAELVARAGVVGFPMLGAALLGQSGLGLVGAVLALSAGIPLGCIAAAARAHSLLPARAFPRGATDAGD